MTVNIFSIYPYDIIPSLSYPSFLLCTWLYVYLQLATFLFYSHIFLIILMYSDDVSA